MDESGAGPSIIRRQILGDNATTQSRSFDCCDLLPSSQSKDNRTAAILDAANSDLHAVAPYFDNVVQAFDSANPSDLEEAELVAGLVAIWRAQKQGHADLFIWGHIQGTIRALLSKAEKNLRAHEGVAEDSDRQAP